MHHSGDINPELLRISDGLTRELEFLKRQREKLRRVAQWLDRCWDEIGMEEWDWKTALGQRVNEDRWPMGMAQDEMEEDEGVDDAEEKEEDELLYRAGRRFAGVGRFFCRQ